jgi:glycogen operon protein
VATIVRPVDVGRPTQIEPGSSAPIGPTIVADGVNFCVWSGHATGLDLLLFDDPADDAPARIVTFDRRINRTGGYWHGFIPGVRAGQAYAYRARGAWAPEAGLRFDERQVLLDPYGRGVAVPAGYDRETDPSAAGYAGRAMKSVVVDTAAYDWEGDTPLRRPLHDTVVYEAHLRGFTAHPNAGVTDGRRGTYAGFVERIPYLVDLGVSAVELLPIFQFDPLAAPAGRTNYWGYQPVSYFAPHAQYASRRDAAGPTDEFRDLVKALHRAGLEVILDVVYNHTAEAGADGPTFSFRGLGNDDYYILGDGGASYADYTGTGNTLDGNAPTVRRLIVDSLRFWVDEMHVDGFRFDLASVLSRDEDGRPLARPPVLWDIDSDPVLAGTKLIAEAWDAAGLYQVGSFVGDRWVEWNGRFRDDARAFVRSDAGRVWAMSQRLLGSPDIYALANREPQKTVNFVTCHDGFTLADLVSYDTKHNEANGEGGRDGSDQNLSWNGGVEGPTGDPEIVALRHRQAKNLLALTMLAVGVPMVTMGDEVLRSQQGNNNAYCQDNELSWFDWTGPEREAGMHRFTRRLIAGRRRAQELLDLPIDVTLGELLSTALIEWHGVRLGEPDRSDDSRSLAVTVRGREVALHIIANAYWEPLDFELPPLDGGATPWRRILDTTLPSPDDIVDRRDAPAVEGDAYRAGPRSVVVLAAGGPAGEATE